MIHVFLLYLAFQGAAQNAQQYQEAGEAALKAGRTDVAISEFRKMVDLAPDRPLGYLELGVAYMQNRDYGEAIPPLRRSLELDPSQVRCISSLDTHFWQRDTPRKQSVSLRQPAIELVWASPNWKPEIS